MAERERKPAIDRFLGYIVRDGNTDCWLWVGASANGRYGVFRGQDQRQRTAHRFAYEYFNGPVPSGREVCHSCDVTFCVNPKHLFVGTRKDNALDMVAKGRQSKGGAHHKAKLSAEDVEFISRSALPQRTLARQFSVSQGAISHIKCGRNWKHLNG